MNTEEFCDCKCSCDDFPTWPQVAMFVGAIAFASAFGAVVMGVFSAAC